MRTEAQRTHDIKANTEEIREYALKSILDLKSLLRSVTQKRLFGIVANTPLGWRTLLSMPSIDLLENGEDHDALRRLLQNWNIRLGSTTQPIGERPMERCMGRILSGQAEFNRRSGQPTHYLAANCDRLNGASTRSLRGWLQRAERVLLPLQTRIVDCNVVEGGLMLGDQLFRPISVINLDFMPPALIHVS